MNEELTTKISSLISSFKTQFQGLQSNELQLHKMDFDYNNVDFDKVVTLTFNNLEIIQINIKKCEEQAQTSLQKAQEAYDKPVGFWRKTTPALEALQNASKNLALTQVSMATSQGLLFQQQEVMAKAIKALFGISVYNITSTRMAVKAIQMKLQNASDEEISAAAKQELENVVIQLKHQLDLLEQQKKLETRVAELENNEQEMSERLEKQQSELENKVLEIGRDTKAEILAIQNKCIDSVNKTIAELSLKKSELQTKVLQSTKEAHESLSKLEATCLEKIRKANDGIASRSAEIASQLKNQSDTVTAKLDDFEENEKARVEQCIQEYSQSFTEKVSTLYKVCAGLGVGILALAGGLVYLCIR